MTTRSQQNKKLIRLENIKTSSPHGYKSYRSLCFNLFRVALIMKLYNYISFIFYTFQFNIMKPFIIFYFLFFMVSRSLSFVHHHVGCILLRMHSRKKGMLLNDGAFRNCFCDLVSIESQSSDGLNHKRTS